MGNATISAVQEKAGDIHDVALGENDTLIDKIGTPTVGIEIDDGLVPSERRTMEPGALFNYELRNYSGT